MPRRWRGRKDGEGTDAPADESGDAPADREPPRPPPAEDLESRLGAGGSPYDRPPTAEELRAAFSRRKNDEVEAPPKPVDDFTSRYTTESLFVSSPVESDEPPIEEPTVDDRSRTKGDYYYDPEDAWAVLGLASGASWKEVAAAHRRLAMKHHPDRLLDASPAEREASEEAMREINVAYSVLRRLTGN